jgi:glycosyltransferase EpsD
MFSNLQYVICGRGPLEDDLKRLAASLDIAEHVHLLGYRKDILELCNCSDIFVFMSLQEGLPAALMEAMACGTPCICSNIRGHEDLIENGKSGILVENDVNELADAIYKLYNDKYLCKTLVENAKERIKQFDFKVVKPLLLSIYQSLEK